MSVSLCKSTPLILFSAVTQAERKAMSCQFFFNAVQRCFVCKPKKKKKKFFFITFEEIIDYFLETLCRYLQYPVPTIKKTEPGKTKQNIKTLQRLQNNFWSLWTLCNISTRMKLARRTTVDIIADVKKRLKKEMMAERLSKTPNKSIVKAI